MTLNLNTMQHVAEFINAMYKFELNFHPDNWFEHYIDYETGLPLFTPEACELYDTAVMRCREICKWHNIDIYELCLAFRGIGRDEVTCKKQGDYFVLGFKNTGTGEYEFQKI